MLKMEGIKKYQEVFNNIESEFQIFKKNMQRGLEKGLTDEQLTKRKNRLQNKKEELMDLELKVNAIMDVLDFENNENIKYIEYPLYFRNIYGEVVEIEGLRAEMNILMNQLEGEK